MAGMAVDMMQDFRTGYLVNANPTHQTSVQVVGTVIGALVAIPFFLLIESKLGFGIGTSLPAPGAVVWATVAKSFTGASELGSGLLTMIIAASAIFSLIAFFTVLA